MNVLIEKETNAFVGQCGILVQEVDGKEEMEIAYAILPAYRNRGYATEAARKCLDFAFENNFANHLVSIIHTENKRSERVAQKCGMKPLRRSIFMDRPVTIYTIEKTEWHRLQVFPQQSLTAG
jgi:RimJ/RimL family protein N-acetyltransferase